MVNQSGIFLIIVQMLKMLPNLLTHTIVDLKKNGILERYRIFLSVEKNLANLPLEFRLSRSYAYKKN